MKPVSGPRAPQSWRASLASSPADMSPYSLHRQEAQSPEKEVYSTTVLASNIHCASCVTHIEEVLNRTDVLAVSVSIVSNEVHILHHSSLSADTLCQALSDEAFEVFSATTLGESDRVIAISNFSPASDDLPSSTQFWRSLTRRYFPSSARNQRRRHIENCEACQRQENAEGPLPFIRKRPRVAQLVNSTSGQDGAAEEACASESKPNDVEISSSDPMEAEPTAQEAQKATHTELPDMRRKLTLQVDGMAYESCSDAVTNALKTIPGVQAVQVDLKSSSAVVEFAGQDSLSALAEQTIKNLGYKAAVTKLIQLQQSGGGVVGASAEHRAILSIGGMTCAACINNISDGLRELPFVQEFSITLMTNSGTVDFRGRSNLDKIAELVEDRGFECAVESCTNLRDTHMTQESSRTVQIQLTGMFCEDCPDQICEALRSKYQSTVEVVKEPSLRSPIIMIRYTPAVPDFTIRDIISTVQSISEVIQASVYHPPTIEERSRKMKIHERNRILQRLALSGFIAIPTFLIGILWMTLVSKNNSMRMYFMTPVWAGSVTRTEWALFILASPVYFYAANLFHVRAFKEIRAMWRPGSKVRFLRRFYRFGSMNLLISAGTSVAYISSLALLGINATSNSSDNKSDTYFDSVVFLTFFILIGRFLEAFSKSKTSDAVSMLGKLKPDRAVLVLETPSEPVSQRSVIQTQSTTIDADLLEIGDKVIVPHGSSPPADGIIISGNGNFDESSLTGESRPVNKTVGGEVFLGTINSGNPVTMRVSKIGGSSMLDQIVSVVREGLSKRAPVERFADILTGYFVPVVTALAIIVFVIWFALGHSGILEPRYLGDQAGGWAFWSLEFAIAVFVVACPCGIGLAAPTALFAGIGLAAKHGILVRGGGEAFQEAPYLDAVVFDKTGTLTEGELKVTDHEIFNTSPEHEKLVWTMICALEEQSSHPIANAIVTATEKMPRTFLSTESITEVPGMGIRGRFSHTPASKATVYEAIIGSQQGIASLNTNSDQAMSSLLTPSMTSMLTTWQSQSKSIAIFALRCISTSNQLVPTLTDDLTSRDWRIAAMFATSDPVRLSALPTIRTLRDRGIAVYMLSGDNQTTARAVGSSLGIPSSNIFAGVLPTEKAEKIRHLQHTLTPRHRNKSTKVKSSPHAPTHTSEHKPSQCSPSELEKGRAANPIAKPAPISHHQQASVAFVGDGTNDAPALLAASVSVSIAHASGSPIALSSSSFVLLSPDLLLLPRLLDLSSRVFRRIRMNFAWALVYNVVLVPVAGGIFFTLGTRDGGDGWRLGPVWASLAMALSSVSVVVSSLCLKWEGGWMFWKMMKKKDNNKKGDTARGKKGREVGKRECV